MAQKYSQNRNKERIPELLLASQVVAVTVEFSGFLVVAVRKADEDPHEDDGSPAGEAVMTLEETIK